jgi:hypothetical protein
MDVAFSTHGISIEYLYHGESIIHALNIHGYAVIDPWNILCISMNIQWYIHGYSIRVDVGILKIHAFFC